MRLHRMIVPAVVGVAMGVSAPAFGQADTQIGPRAGSEGGVRPRPYAGHKLVRVFTTSAKQRLAVTQLGMGLADEAVRRVGGTDFIASPLQLATLRELSEEMGFRIEIVNADVQAVVDAERDRIDRRRALRGVDSDPFFAEYRELSELYAYWDAFLAAYPDMVSKQTVGTSIQGRPIYVYTLSAPGGTEGKPAIFFNSGAHAREWIAPMTTAYIATRLLEGYGSDAVATSLMDGLVFEIMPVANPDGYLYSWTNERYWRKTRRNNGNGTYGVDWNRNFETGFGVGSDSNTSSDVYRGTSPFSEPETQAFRDFLLANTDIVAHIDFHSYSQLVLYPWGDRDVSVPEPDLSIFEDLSYAMRDAIYDTHGVSYTAMQAVDLYPAGGTSQDWAYDSGVFSWTIELRPADGSGLGGFSPSATQILPTGQENFEAVRVLGAAVSAGVAYSFAAGEQPVLIPDELSPVAFGLVPAFSGPLDSSTAVLHARVGGSGPFAASPLSGSGNVYSGVLPAAACGETVEYYVTIDSVSGQTYTVPAGAPGVSVFSGVALEESVVFSDDAEEQGGWVVGAPGDTATTGVWEIADPQATGAQPGDDHSAGGTRCWVTDGLAGSGIGTYDIDGGATSLTSPRLDALNGQGDAEVSFWLWYSNDQGSSPGEDVFRVMISDDDGATWSVLDTIAENANAWVQHRYRVADFVSATDAVRLRFVAEDAGSGSIVEAAVDDVMLTFVGCPGSSADLTGDGVLDIDDVLAFLDAFASGEAGADFAPPVGVFNIDDVLGFLNAFAAG